VTSQNTGSLMSHHFHTLSSEQQEAECVKYIIGVRVIPLSTGNFALYDPHHRLISIVPTLDPLYFQLICSAQAEKYKASARPTKLSADQLLKELNL